MRIISKSKGPLEQTPKTKDCGVCPRFIFQKYESKCEKCGSVVIVRVNYIAPEMRI
jgi:hypothetical protein